MKIIKSLIILGFAFVMSSCVGVVEHPAAVYIEPRPVEIVEPARIYEVVIVNGVPVRRIIVAPRPIVVHRHHH